MRLSLPSGHGEVLTWPSGADWPEQAAQNARRAADWGFTVAGIDVAVLRARARDEARAAASAFSERLPVPFTRGEPRGPILMTGHQPSLFHPGVWLKTFLVERLAEELGGVAINLVVDSDEYETLGIRCPRMSPRIARRWHALGGAGCYSLSPPPPMADIDRFAAEVLADLRTLPAPAIACHFARFCDDLREAHRVAGNVSELITFARRRYEAAADTRYLEVPVTDVADTASFRAFVVELAFGAERFCALFNEEVDAYRSRNRIRSAARPFPNLERRGDLWELPFWVLGERGRTSLWVRPGPRPSLFVDDVEILQLSSDPRESVELAARLPHRLAPKALALTLFHRLLVADLFLHGIGGYRYDHVTDAVIESYFEIEPPSFAVASMTMYLPIGVKVVTDRQIEEAQRRIERFHHNPDEFLDEVLLPTPDERRKAYELSRKKARLVIAVQQEGADRRALGEKIRIVNQELSRLLAHVGEDLRLEEDRLRAERDAADILTDRTYPFCFWDPREVQDKASSLEP